MNPFDKSGKRKLTKKEVGYRSFNITRFRSLKAGDYVAARMASHELWVLARVTKDWNALNVSHTELLNMSEAKRTTLFSNQLVHIQDIEEYDGDVNKSKLIGRHLILPLPRTFDEAEDWCTRCRKGTRVYAMYPNTTSLYCATAIDNTTYCRGDDDIVVVEFDGDEDDHHNLPQRHIPARFVTFIPPEFPAAKVKKKVTKRVGAGRASPTNKKRSATPSTKASKTSAPPGGASVASESSSIDESLISALAQNTSFGGLGDLGSFSFDDILIGSSTSKKQVNVATSYADIMAPKTAQEEHANLGGTKTAKKKAKGEGRGNNGTAAKGNKSSSKKRGSSKGADKSSTKSKKAKK